MKYGFFPFINKSRFSAFYNINPLRINFMAEKSILLEIFLNDPILKKHIQNRCELAVRQIDSSNRGFSTACSARSLDP
ncbi:MAG: hypothetical protein ACOC6P_03265 [Candidatus Aminicenantaceae bacterium]